MSRQWLLRPVWVIIQVMLRAKVALYILICTAFLVGCGTQAKRPSQDVLIAGQVLKHVERLRMAYSARDMVAMEALIMPEAFREIRYGVKQFSSVDITMEGQWIDIKEDGSIEVRISWAGRWHIDRSLEATDKGVAVFVLSGSPLRLEKVRGLSPFAAPASTGKL